jgi:hypothetical protein
VQAGRSPFKPRKSRKTEYSDNPKTTANRELDTTKRGWDVAIRRLDIWFRTTKSRRLTKLNNSKAWKKLSPQQREVRENNMVNQLKAEKEKRLNDLEKE